MSTVAIPGTTFERRALPAAPGVPTDTGQAFFVGFAEKGPTTPVLLTSAGQYAPTFGGRTGVYAILADSVEAFFGEGGAAVWVCRAVGPTPVAASVTLVDASAAETLTFTAASVGAWANGAAGGLDVVVADGTDSGSKVTITLDDVAVETVDNLADVDAILAAFANSDHVVVTDEASVSVDPMPANGTFPLTAGDDDNDSATDAEWAAALDAFDITLGPGQVGQPGRTSAAAHAQLIAHAAERNRTPILGAVVAATKSQLMTAAGSVEDLDDAERAGLFATWYTIPQLVPGIDRTVPPDGVIAGLIARNDAQNNPGSKPTAARGGLRYALAAVTTFSDTDRTDLYEAGVNCTLDDPQGLRLYGFRSVSSDPDWRDLSHSRIFMELEALSDAQDENWVDVKITTVTIGDLNSAKRGLARPIFDRGDLYGDRLEDAVRVVTEPPVNTPATAAARTVTSEVYLRFAESAELVRTIVTKVPVTTTV